MSQVVVGGHTHFSSFMFLWGCANMSGLIVTGSVTSRINMTAFVTLIITVCAIIYPIVAYWTQGNGWLAVTNPDSLQLIDFASSLPVQLVGGFAALTAAFIVGPRHDRFVYNASTGCVDNRREPGHSIVFSLLGTFLLWFGWFAYISGATHGISGDKHLVAAHSIVNMIIAAGVGSLTITAYHMFFSDVHNLTELLNGIMCGLVAIAPGAATVEPWSALLIGAGSILAYRAGVRFLEWMRVDDVVESFAIHGCCSIFGSIATAILSRQEHCDRLYGAGQLNFSIGHQLGVQLLGLIVTAVFTIVCTAIPLLVLKRFNPLRVAFEDEQLGLDLVLHGGYAYPDFKEKMAILKNQVVLEAELGAAVKSAAAAGSKEVNANKLDAVTEKIRQIDDMRKAASTMTSDAMRDRIEVSQGGNPSRRRGSMMSPNRALATRGVVPRGKDASPPAKYLTLGAEQPVDDRAPTPSVAWHDHTASNTTRERKIEGSASNGGKDTISQFSMDAVRIRISSVGGSGSLGAPSPSVPGLIGVASAVDCASPIFDTLDDVVPLSPNQPSDPLASMPGSPEQRPYLAYATIKDVDEESSEEHTEESDEIIDTRRRTESASTHQETLTLDNTQQQ